MLRRVAAFCRPLRPVLPLVSFARSRSPVAGVPGLCWMCASPVVENRELAPPSHAPHTYSALTARNPLPLLQMPSTHAIRSHTTHHIGHQPAFIEHLPHHLMCSLAPPTHCVCTNTRISSCANCEVSTELQNPHGPCVYARARARVTMCDQNCSGSQSRMRTVVTGITRTKIGGQSCQSLLCHTHVHFSTARPMLHLLSVANQWKTVLEPLSRSEQQRATSSKILENPHKS